AGAVEKAAWGAAAAGWDTLTRGASSAISAAGTMPRALPRAATDVGRALLGRETVPQYQSELPRSGGSVRRPGGRGRASAETLAVYLPACVHTMFGAAEEPRGGCGGNGGGSGAKARAAMSAARGDAPAAANPSFDGSVPVGAPSSPTEPTTSTGRVGIGVLAPPTGHGVSSSVSRLADRAVVRRAVPDDAASLCCSSPCSAKGMTGAKERMRQRVRAALLEASRGGELPVSVDAAS